MQINKPRSLLPSGDPVHLSKPELHMLGYSSLLKDTAQLLWPYMTMLQQFLLASILPSEPNHLRLKEENQKTTFITEAGEVKLYTSLHFS